MKQSGNQRAFSRYQPLGCCLEHFQETFAFLRLRRGVSRCHESGRILQGAGRGRRPRIFALDLIDDVCLAGRIRTGKAINRLEVLTNAFIGRRLDRDRRRRLDGRFDELAAREHDACADCANAEFCGTMAQSLHSDLSDC